MSVLNKRDPLLLFCGDLVIFLASLWLTLLIRYTHTPSVSLYTVHLVPFSLLFIAWFIMLFIAGLYEKKILVVRNKISTTIFRVQIINSVIAIMFFYFIPIFGITPKTLLFIYLIISFVLLLAWRTLGSAFFGPKLRLKALLLAEGPEMKELRDEINRNPHYNLHFVTTSDIEQNDPLHLKEEVIRLVKDEHISSIVIDFNNAKVEAILPHLYNLIFSGVVFIDMNKVYEDVFDRIPLSLIKYSWFLQNISLAPKRTYDVFKKIMDVVIALPLALISLVFYPFVYIAMMFDEGKGLFSVQERVGQNNKSIKMFKFRTMSIANDGGEWGSSNQNKVTKLGDFLRKTRIDEVPQLWNVVFGDISLIGPRPEFYKAVKQYETEIPYYSVRHLIKPGLSGWAQIYHDNHPHHGVGVEQTKEKLSYDLFYLKNRSFILDVIIALKTVKKLLSLAGK